MIGHLNIYSIRNEFDSFKYLIDENIGIILLSETKLNDTFPVNLNSLGNYLNELCKKYDNFILSGDFYSEMCEDAMLELSSVYNLKNVVKNPRVIRI